MRRSGLWLPAFAVLSAVFQPIAFCPTAHAFLYDTVADCRVCTLVDDVQPAGRWNVEWKGMDESGNATTVGALLISRTPLT